MLGCTFRDALAWGSNKIDTPHMLLALSRMSKITHPSPSTAIAILDKLGISIDRVRELTAEAITSSPQEIPTPIPNVPIATRISFDPPSI